MDAISIERRFNGPPDSANGGYACGRLAAYVDGPAKVRLRVPPPLERALRVERGERVRLFDGETLVAEAWSSPVDLPIPEPPTFEAAEAAGHGFRGFAKHYYPTCFVCGTERKPDDGLRIFAGPLASSGARSGTASAAFACAWDASATATGTGGEDELLAPEMIWAALDCPGGFAFAEPANASILLGEFNAHLFEPAPARARYLLLAWEIAHEGRKHHTGTAIFSESGLCHGIARGIWFEVPN